MKYLSQLLLLCCVFVIYTASTCQKNAITEPVVSETKKEVQKKQPMMLFDKSHFDLGVVKKGEKRELEYHFTNTGTEDLEIDIISACECTTLDYDTAPYAPGAKGVITAVFDSSEKTEDETITITIVLKNTHPGNDYPIVEELTYDFDIEM